MLVLLIGGALIHAAHYSEVFGLLAGMRQPQKEDLEPIERPRILVLSASGASTFAADAMLHHLGASVRTVMESDDAERLLDIWRPNVLIITFWSGALGAWCRGLRGKLSFTDLPILVLGDRDDEQEVLEVLDAGADAYLAQPFGAALLVSQVQSFLGRSNWERRTIGDKSTLLVDPIAQPPMDTWSGSAFDPTPVSVDALSGSASRSHVFFTGAVHHPCREKSNHAIECHCRTNLPTA
ncbi:response regulator transcription factor [Acidithiobacillus ferrooxidans]|uniref:response regulator transcription factor n=1 Tax=Acidithiobacillus ferrooxidans TaxID=920 RepID=UPI001D004235|nr:hypothetical protein [Acidithiobacillus ferrooxidans]